MSARDRLTGGEPPGGVAAEKARLRDGFRAWRAALSNEAWAGASARIVGRLAAVPEVAGARTVHAFWPVAARREVDLRPLLDRLHRTGVRVVLPVVASGPGERPALVHRLYAGPASLAAGRWGLAEPASTPEVPPEALDVVLVPALAAARDGHRLGWGAGFYDAFLAGVSAPTVCPVYAAALVPRLPSEPHDRPVDVVVTEDETVRR
jgi:5-formyltetrahydrofolate cyclo-ligase